MPGQVIKRGKTKPQRAALRSDIGRLSDTLLSTIAKNRYENAISIFFLWLENTGRVLPSEEKVLDELLCQYVETVWEEGEVKSMVGDLLSGLGSLCKALKGKYPTAWSLYTAWGKVEMPVRATPFTAEDVMALSGRCLQRGLRGLSVGLLVCFHCVLRTGELLGLRKAHCKFSPDAKSCLLHLGWTKGGKRRGVEETVKITDAFISQLLFVYMEKRAASDKLVPLDYQAFRKELSGLLSYLSLDKMGFRTYSLRRGGATYHFRKTGSYDATCERGRWANAKTARGYIDEASGLSERDRSPSIRYRRCKDLVLNLM
jgi:integrase